MLSRRLLRIKALKALYAHLQCGGDNLIASQKRLLLSVDNSYDLYFLLLQLPVAMAEYSRSMQKIAREKHLATYEDLNPNTKFVDSPVVHLLENSDALNDHLTTKGLSWRAHPEFVKSLYNALRESEFFKVYMNSSDRGIKEDVAMLEHFYVELLQGDELIEQVEDVVAQISIYMCGDLSFVLPLVLRTLTSIRPSHSDIKVVKKFKNIDDENFVRSLFEKALVNHAKYQSYIERFTVNWDLERIVLMDNLILVVAMAELLNFPDIPTKVTMDEFIEISKDYSTQGSSTFVNGILDRVVASLNEEGAIKKVGRGLL